MLIWYRYGCVTLLVFLQAQGTAFHSLPQLRAASSALHVSMKAREALYPECIWKIWQRGMFRTRHITGQVTVDRTLCILFSNLEVLLLHLEESENNRAVSLGFFQWSTTIFSCNCLHNESAHKSKSAGLLPSMITHIAFWRLSVKKKTKNEVKGGKTMNRQADTSNIFKACLMKPKFRKVNKWLQSSFKLFFRVWCLILALLFTLCTINASSITTLS